MRATSSRSGSRNSSALNHHFVCEAGLNQARNRKLTHLVANVAHAIIGTPGKFNVSGLSPQISGVSFSLPLQCGSMMEHRTSGHAAWDIKYHVIWITKHRYKVL